MRWLMLLKLFYYHITSDLEHNLYREDVFGGSIPLLPIILYPNEYAPPFLCSLEESGISMKNNYFNEILSHGLALLDVCYGIIRLCIASAVVGIFFVVAVLLCEWLQITVVRRWGALFGLLRP